MEAFFPIIETKVLKSSSMHSLNTSILKVFSEELASTYWAEELWGSLYCLPWLRNELLSVELQCIFYERWLSHCFGTTHVHHSHWYSENTQRYSIFCLFVCFVFIPGYLKDNTVKSSFYFEIKLLLFWRSINSNLQLILTAFEMLLYTLKQSPGKHIL